ncbi:endonuclease MutS2 [Youngiibacter fragilis]|uniref:Endonuclease MutS2 n=1 Tax=Youngiibacter fragilis 232.1 TaxID=994573 RepID=V7I4K1_9CLOT|nr:endonuclease MutS2 [Youngiibacter fragilis]ETA80221.1 DNA mismatch repair protein MutS [Youngiibacter fragilis 232.1]
MNRKSMEKLEYFKIIEKVKSYAVCSAGADMISLMEPYEHREDIERSLSETEEAAALLYSKGSAPFEGIYDVRDTLKFIGKGGSTGASGLLRIANILKSSREFKDYVGSSDSHRHLREILYGVTPYKALENEIFIAIIGENEVSDKASTELFGIRRALKDKTSSVKEKIQSLVRSNEKFLQDNLYTVRGDRYVLPVKSEHKGSVPGLVHDQSATGQTLFIEPMSLVNLNNEIKELMLKEKAEVERILRMLSGRVQSNIAGVTRNADAIYELDMIFARAKYSMSVDGTRPEVKDDLSFELVQARHPLIPKDVVVPSTIYMKSDHTVIVITGPNTGGKTVTLKTVGLLHLMAMAGILIPVNEGSSIGNFQEIYADIGDEQSIEQSLSTFSSHMTNIVSIIDKADERSLVLFDELGAGTDPTEGAALAAAILDTLKERKVRIIATTHYSELKVYALKSTGTVNASVEFDVETLRPTYRLLIGVPGKSNAFLISKRLGLPDYIVERSKGFIDSETLKFEDLLENLQTDSMKATREAEEAKALRVALQRKQEELDRKLSRIDEIRENALQDAKREGRRYLREAKEKSDEILKDLRELEKSGYSTEGRKKLQGIREKIQSGLDSQGTEEREQERVKGTAAKDLTPGSEVLLATLNQRVTVLTRPDRDGNVQVQAGIMKMNVHMSDLLEAKETKEQKQVRKREVRLNLKAVSSSCDVRGLDSGEAAYRVDMYLDEASLGGLTEVTIIHGIGTGVLKDEIGKMLRNHPHVRKSRPGEYGEGGQGVTIVTLR